MSFFIISSNSLRKERKKNLLGMGAISYRLIICKIDMEPILYCGPNETGNWIYGLLYLFALLPQLLCLYMLIRRHFFPDRTISLFHLCVQTGIQMKRYYFWR